jgi:electron transfer flavoprotein beta subunit
MKIVVCVKQVGRIDDEVEFVDDDRSVDEDFLDWELNEWDGFAVEAGLRLGAETEGEVMAVTVGPDRAEEALRYCLAMGVDRVARIEPDDLTLDGPVEVAGALAAFVRDESPDLVLCGVQSGDMVNGATGGALAGHLDMPVVSVVTDITRDGAALRVRRELEGGLAETLEVTLPAVLTIQTGVNVPRYVTMREILQAEGRPIQLFEPPAAADGAEREAVRRRVLSIPERREPEAIEGDAAAIAARLHTMIREAVDA